MFLHRNIQHNLSMYVSTMLYILLVETNEKKIVCHIYAYTCKSPYHSITPILMLMFPIAQMNGRRRRIRAKQGVETFLNSCSLRKQMAIRSKSSSMVASMQFVKCLLQGLAAHNTPSTTMVVKTRMSCVCVWCVCAVQVVLAQCLDLVVNQVSQSSFTKTGLILILVAKTPLCACVFKLMFLLYDT